MSERVFTNSDEDRHAPGQDPWWAEGWSFEFWVAGGDLGGYACLTLLPNRHQAWYWAALVGERWPLLSVVDLDVALPRSRLEIRAEALWAEHICEIPFEHWTVANETVAVALDDPHDALMDARGVPTPLGFDLEWESTSPVVATGEASYVQDCQVTGEVLVASGRGPDRLSIDARGRRGHGWHLGRWWEASTSKPRPGRRAPVLLEVNGERFGIERSLTADGWGEWVQRLSGP